MHPQMAQRQTLESAPPSEAKLERPGDVMGVIRRLIDTHEQISGGARVAHHEEWIIGARSAEHRTGAARNRSRRWQAAHAAHVGRHCAGLVVAIVPLLIAILELGSDI